ncbi:hypothetical protein ACEPAI_9724 [Sanghuangporus weigelae]
MATESQSASPPTTTTTTTTTGPPQLTVLTRVASIPLINDSLTSLHSTLLNNSLTKTPYSTAQALSSYAISVTEPIQVRLAPVIRGADGLANKAVDVVESRYPYPFHAPTEEIYGTIKAHSEHAYGFANKTIDDKVRAPAYGIVHGIDQRFAPVVDRFAYVVNSIHSKQSSAAAEAPGQDSASGSVPGTPKDEYQYKRAYRLSVDLKDTLYVLTNEQVKQIQEHNVLVQRATLTAHSITQTISSSVESASARIHALSDSMLNELHSLQASAAALPSALGLNNLQEKLAPVIGEVKDVLKSEAPVKEKVGKLRKVVEESVKPILEVATARVQGAVNAVRARTVEGADSAKSAVNGVNGTMNAPETPPAEAVNGNSH